MPLVVQKFGGTSLATPKHIQRAAQRVRETKRAGFDVVVVVSAMGRMTDHLVSLAKKTVKRPLQRELDMLMTAGERVSMSLLAMALHEEGIPAISFTGSQSGIITTNDHTEARIVEIRPQRIREQLESGKVVIIAGFQGVSLTKEVTTLGRGGSDTTAVALGAELGAEVCEILTDVEGLYSADPRLVPQTRLLKTCGYDEAIEMAGLGAKMHVRSLELAKRYSVKVRITSSLIPTTKNTMINDLGEGAQGMEKVMVRGISSRDGFHFFKVRTKLADLMDLIRQERIALRFFQNHGEECQFLCEVFQGEKVRAAIVARGWTFEEAGRISIISAVGEGVLHSADLLPDFFAALSDAEVPCFLICSNTMSLTAAIPTARNEIAVQAVHRKLIERIEN